MIWKFIWKNKTRNNIFQILKKKKLKQRGGPALLDLTIYFQTTIISYDMGKNEIYKLEKNNGELKTTHTEL